MLQFADEAWDADEIRGRIFVRFWDLLGRLSCLLLNTAMSAIGT